MKQYLKDLSNDSLSLYTAMCIFLTDVTIENYQEIYKKLKEENPDSISSQSLWEPFENYPSEFLLAEIESHKEFLKEVLDSRSEVK